MKKNKRISTVRSKLPASHSEKGAALIVVILVLAFLLSIGIVLLTMTATGPKVAENIRDQQRVFNAAEAGFDAAWRVMNQNLTSGAWDDFADQYRTTFGGAEGLDNPLSENYFRRRTDRELVEDISVNEDNFIFSSEELMNDDRYRYTVFLINDEGGIEAQGGVPNHIDAILVCIGQGPRNTYVRLEIEIEIQ